jgi:hypothetical protein
MGSAAPSAQRAERGDSQPRQPEAPMSIIILIGFVAAAVAASVVVFRWHCLATGSRAAIPLDREAAPAPVGAEDPHQ